MIPARARLCCAVVLCVVFGCGAIASGAEPAIRVQLDPQKLGVEDSARLIVTIKNPGKRSPIPAVGQLDNFAVVAGPSTENRFSWVNGEATSEAIFTYILQPQQVGPARIGAVGVSIGTKVLKSKPIDAVVVAGSVAPPRHNRRTRPTFYDRSFLHPC